MQDGGFPIASSIDGKGITPWIVAGDDTVLASNSDDENVIQDLLTTFQKNLQIQFLDVEPRSPNFICRFGLFTW